MKQENGATRIANERKRQIEVEGWTAKHDAQHTDFELEAAARCYAMMAAVEQPDHSYEMREMGEPKCGMFCDNCGDCLHCCAEGWERCDHHWVIYLDDPLNLHGGARP